MTEQKFATHHGRLQSMLSHLGKLSPRRTNVPMFSSRDAAEHVIAISATATGKEVALTPVWGIDHDDLIGSEVIAWTVTGTLN